MSNLSDSDDSDNDFLLQERAFAKPKPTKKPELTPMNALQRIISGKPSLPKKDKKEHPSGRKRPRKQTGNKKRAELKKAKSIKGSVAIEKGRRDRQNDPAWIETQARKTVEEVLKLDAVEKINSLDDVGWYCCADKRGKKITYYPAISSQNKAEAKMLLKGRKSRKFKTKKIQYMGVSWRYALAHEEIALSKWIPFSECSDSENEERLKSFIEAIAKTSLLKNDPMGLKIEELAIRKMWNRVKSQKEKRQQDEEKERVEAIVSANGIKALATEAPSMTVTQESDSNSLDSEQKEDTDKEDDNADQYDDENLSSPGKNTRKRTALHVSDEIEFYDPMAVFGNASALRKATVVGIRPDNQSYPLLLSNSIIPIPSSHRVRRLPDGNWQAVSDFALLKEGKQFLADSGTGLNNAVRNMRKISKKVTKARDDFWKNSHGAIEKEEGTAS